MNERENGQDWQTAPGSTISAILKRKAMDAAEFAELIGEPLSTVNQLLAGEVPITEIVARKLEHATEVPSNFWLSRELRYRKSIAVNQITLGIGNEIDLLRNLPISDMRKFGWITISNKFDSKLQSVFAFFGVNSAADWTSKYSRYVSVAAYRTSVSHENDPFAVTAWLRKAEIECQKISLRKWDREKFKRTLFELTKLMRVKRPEDFLPVLTKSCAECGVAVVVVRAPQGNRASGATKFLSNGSAMIALSMRFKSDDHFWFTFFHEAAHLILHSEEALFLEDESEVTEIQEEEANRFAVQIMFPELTIDDFRRIQPHAKTIIREALRHKVSAGVLLGRMQFLGLIPYNRMNSLKRRYKWTEENRPTISP